MSYDADVLRENSYKFAKLIEILNEHEEHFIHVPHNAHLAVELASKAFLCRNGQTIVESHDLHEIFQKTFNKFPKGLLGALQANGSEEVYTAYKQIKAVWNMNMRYEKWKFKKSTVNDHCIAYKKVFVWIDKL